MKCFVKIYVLALDFPSGPNQFHRRHDIPLEQKPG